MHVKVKSMDDMTIRRQRGSGKAQPIGVVGSSIAIVNLMFSTGPEPVESKGILALSKNIKTIKLLGSMTNQTPLKQCCTDGRG